MSEEQDQLLGKMTAHNTAELKKLFEQSTIAGDWQLIFAASYNGCILSLPAEGGGHVRLRIAAKYRHGTPYLELRTERMGGPPEAAPVEAADEDEDEEVEVVAESGDGTPPDDADQDDDSEDAAAEEERMILSRSGEFPRPEVDAEAEEAEGVDEAEEEDEEDDEEEKSPKATAEAAAPDDASDDESDEESDDESDAESDETVEEAS